MNSALSSLLPVLALVSHIVFVFLVACCIFYKSWGQTVVRFLGKHSLRLGLFASCIAVAGSLFYSEIMGFEACILCWWQRVLLYPSVFIFAMALWRRERSAYYYVIPLAVLAGIIGIYQSYVYLGGSSLLTCTSAEGACLKIYVMAFGYITIPLMSATVSMYLLLFAWANKIYQYYEKNSNA